VIPAYYNDPERWVKIMQQSMQDVYPFFDSDRMAQEYFDRLYLPAYNPVERNLAAMADRQ